MRAAVLAVLIALLGAASAHAATVSVPSVKGRVLYEYRYYGNNILVTQAVVVGAPKGTEVDFVFAKAHYHATVDASGVYNFKTVLPKLGHPGTVWSFTLTNPTRHARTSTYTARSRRPPLAKRTCSDASGEIDCLAHCPTGRDYVDPYTDDPCATANDFAHLPHSSVADDFRGNRKYTQVKQLEVSRVPHGATVVVLCHGTKSNGTDCPFFLRAATPSTAGKVNVARIVGAYKFHPRVQLSIWVLRGVSPGDVVRYTFRSGKLPRFEQLCMPATSLTLTPKRC